MNHDHSQHGEQPKLFWRPCYTNGLIVFESLAASLLLRKHRVHFFGVLPILQLLSCPLMHFFAHGACTHGASNTHQSDGKRTSVASREL